MNKKNIQKWLIYGAVPLVLSLVLQAMYFSGNLVLQRLICPKLPPLTPDSYREFGLLENLQNLLLLAILVTVLVGAFRSIRVKQRLAFCALSFMTLFIFLEEVDYGTHYYAYLSTESIAGWFEPATSPSFQALLAKSDFSSKPFNLHNQGNVTDIIKNGVSVLILGLFVVLPFFSQRITNPWLRYLLPDRFLLITVIVMVLLRFVTRYLGHLDEQLILAAQSTGETARREVGAMNNNLSEFREIITYYLFLLYLGAIVFFRSAPSAPEYLEQPPCKN